MNAMIDGSVRAGRPGLYVVLSRIMTRDDLGGDLASTAVTESKAHAEAATTS